MPLLDRVAEQRRARDALHLRRHTLHAGLGLLRPRDDLFRLHVERRIEAATCEEHVARRQAQQIVGVGAEVFLGLIGVHAHTPEDQQPRLLLAHEREDLLEALTVEQRDAEIHPVVGRQLAGDLEMRLIDLG